MKHFLRPTASDAEIGEFVDVLNRQTPAVGSITVWPATGGDGMSLWKVTGFAPGRKVVRIMRGDRADAARVAVELTFEGFDALVEDASTDP